MKQNILELTYTLETIDIAVKRFWETLNNHTVFAFSGEMGAGKTTFIHRLCDFLAVEDTVSSPTFALVNEYHFLEVNRDSIIYHMDWYRLKSEEEAMGAGMEDYLVQAGKKQVRCFIEWPEKAMGIMPLAYVFIQIEAIDMYQRNMRVYLVNKD